MPAFLPDTSFARSAGGGTGSTGGGTGRGAGVAHSGPAGLSAQAPEGGPMVGGGESFGPGNVFNGGMTGGYQSFGPPPSEFQPGQYGYPVTTPGYTAPFGGESRTAFQQSQYQGAQSGPALTTGVPAPGVFASLQARGIEMGTCLWDCTAEYTPTECQLMCNPK